MRRLSIRAATVVFILATAFGYVLYSNRTGSVEWNRERVRRSGESEAQTTGTAVFSDTRLAVEAVSDPTVSHDVSLATGQATPDLHEEAISASSAPAAEPIARPESDVSEHPKSPSIAPQTRPAKDLASSRDLIDVRHFGAERQRVEMAVTRDQGRSEKLVAYSRTAAAAGEYLLAAASCAIFLDEFGDDNPMAPRIAIRMGDCLAPLDVDNVEITTAADGPQFNPLWRTRHPLISGRLHQAIAAYRYAAEISRHGNERAEALLKLGWLYRASNDWNASTEVWDECAQHNSGLRSGQEALYLAAENLALMNQNQAAAERLHRLAALAPEKPWAKFAREKAESLTTTSREVTK